MDNKDIINQYQQYITFDKPIPYIAQSMMEIYIQTEKQIQQIKSTLSINNDNDDNKLKQKTINIMEQSLKNMVLNIYPFTVQDYYYFGLIECLQIRKDEIPDPKIITMKYLDFLFYDNKYIVELLLLLKTCLKLTKEQIKFDKDNKGHTILILNNIVYTWKDFDLIKEIICCQNIIDYDDKYIDPKFRQAIEKARAYKNRHKKNQPSLEELMSCVVASTSYKYEDIYNMTIRKFYMILNRTSYKLEYQIIKTGMYNGTVKPDEQMLHWQDSLINTNKYQDVISDYDSLKSKIGNVIQDSTKLQNK